MGLLQSFQKESSRSSTLVHTRVVARVLLRVGACIPHSLSPFPTLTFSSTIFILSPLPSVQWRQHYFRPNRPLPRYMTKGPTRLERRMPFRRFFLDIIMGLFCLGIPYLFVDRSQHHRLDEESGLRSPGPMLMIGGCACLVVSSYSFLVVLIRG